MPQVRIKKGELPWDRIRKRSPTKQIQITSVLGNGYHQESVYTLSNSEVGGPYCKG